MTEHSHCTNAWCGQALSRFQRRAYKKECSLCERERQKAEKASQIAEQLGENNNRSHAA